MFDFYLPCRSQFIEILSNNEIIDWEAKIFWSFFKPNKDYVKQLYRQQMYAGLKILHRNGYLEVKISPFNRRLFLYSEAPKLKLFREKILVNDYENIFKKEIETVTKNLEKLNDMQSLITDLSETYPLFKARFLKANNEIHSDKIMQQKKL